MADDPGFDVGFAGSFVSGGLSDTTCDMNFMNRGIGNRSVDSQQNGRVKLAAAGFDLNDFDLGDFGGRGNVDRLRGQFIGPADSCDLVGEQRFEFSIIPRTGVEPFFVENAVEFRGCGEFVQHGVLKRGAAEDAECWDEES